MSISKEDVILERDKAIESITMTKNLIVILDEKLKTGRKNYEYFISIESITQDPDVINNNKKIKNQLDEIESRIAGMKEMIIEQESLIDNIDHLLNLI